MIHQRTVLVLGAGASVEYGLPLGSQLNNKLIDILNPGSDSVKEISNATGFDLNLLKQMGEDLKLSQVNSIDEWLRKNQNFLEIGKTCISYLIANDEHAGRLYGGWYRTLWNMMHSGAQEPEELIKNNLSIITFNYDRSLENFLLAPAKALFGRKDNRCIEALKSIPIVHAFGQIGYLDWQTNNDKQLERQYGSKITWQEAKRFSKMINTIGEKNDSATIKASQDLISKAHFILFLGFGFHQENLKLIRPQKFDGLRECVGVYAGVAPGRFMDSSKNGFGHKINIRDFDTKTSPLASFLKQWEDALIST